MVFFIFHSFSFFQSLPDVVVRDEDNAKFWTPVLNVLSEQDLERINEEQERAARWDFFKISFFL